MSAHTPGPWASEEGGFGQRAVIAPRVGAMVAITAGHHAEGNARLIAAAPEMHESLVAIVSAYDKWVRDEIADEDLMNAISDEAHRARDIIAKAAAR